MQSGKTNVEEGNCTSCQLLEALFVSIGGESRHTLLLRRSHGDDRDARDLSAVLARDSVKLTSSFTLLLLLPLSLPLLPFAFLPPPP